MTNLLDHNVNFNIAQRPEILEEIRGTQGKSISLAKNNLGHALRLMLFIKTERSSYFDQQNALTRMQGGRTQGWESVC